jgi:catechol 2,3-dioxygenase-like lactoylglutathione lyase family enzyme
MYLRRRANAIPQDAVPTPSHREASASRAGSGFAADAASIHGFVPANCDAIIPGPTLTATRPHQEKPLLTRPDHCTIAVTDLAAGIAFFETLGFEVTIRAVISGPIMEAYMGVPGLEADHVTLNLVGSEAHFEIQLLHYRHPTVVSDPNIHNLARPGFNHLCFAVDDIEATIATVTAKGVKLRNELLTYHNRKLVFLDGPEGVTIELAQWT